MIEALERPSVTSSAPHASRSVQRAARRTMFAQIERLERELAALVAASWPRKDLPFGAPHERRRAPRILDLGELEEVRDALAHRVEGVRRDLEARKRVEDANRRLVEDMLRDPAGHRWVRVSHADIGEPGCRHWHVVPRLGFIGMFANWWRVKISSGCPLAQTH